MWMITVVVVMVIVGFGGGVQGQHLLGNHICKQEERYKVTVEKHSKKNVTRREFVWCLNVPPRCSRYKTFEIDDITVKEEDRVRLVDKCCKGYIEDETKTYCLPQCKSCKYGSCISPDICLCEPGYTGPSCNQIKCPPNYYGPYCMSRCNCNHGSKCDSSTGNCICEPGYTGLNCNITNINGTEEITEENNIVNQSPEQEIASLSVQEIIKKGQHTSLPPLEISKPEKLESNILITKSNEGNAVSPSRLDDPETPKKNFDFTGKVFQFSDNNSLKLDEINKYSLKNNYYIVFIISSVIGATAILIILIAMFFTIRKYKKQRNLIIKNCIGSNDDNINKFGLSSQPVLEKSSIFHTPLPDPPFDFPVFSLKEEEPNSPPRMQANSVTYSNCAESINEMTYDEPPSMRSTFRPDSTLLQSVFEPVYDEIPACSRPTTVMCSTGTHDNSYPLESCHVESEKCQKSDTET